MVYFKNGKILKIEQGQNDEFHFQFWVATLDTLHYIRLYMAVFNQIYCINVYFVQKHTYVMYLHINMVEDHLT